MSVFDNVIPVITDENLTVVQLRTTFLLKRERFEVVAPSTFARIVISECINTADHFLKGRLLSNMRNVVTIPVGDRVERQLGYQSEESFVLYSNAGITVSIECLSCGDWYVGVRCEHVSFESPACKSCFVGMIRGYLSAKFDHTVTKVLREGVRRVS